MCLRVFRLEGAPAGPRAAALFEHPPKTPRMPVFFRFGCALRKKHGKSVASRGETGYFAPPFSNHSNAEGRMS